MSIEQEEYLTPEEVAGKVTMSLKFVKTHIQTRRMPGMVRVGRHWRFRRTDVEKRDIRNDAPTDRSLKIPDLSTDMLSTYYCRKSGHALEQVKWGEQALIPEGVLKVS